ncbi:MAG: hypothetical protein ACOYJG_04065 [Prevotella sp.]
MRILRFIMVLMLPFIGFSTVWAQSEQGKTLETSVNKEHYELNDELKVPVTPLSMMGTPVNTFPSVQPIKTAIDSVAFFNNTSAVTKDLNPMLQGYAAQEAYYNELNGIGFHRQGMYQFFEGMSVYAGSMMDEHPNLLTTRSMNFGLYGEFGNWDFTAAVEVNRYMSAWPASYYNHVTNQYGIAGSLTYHFNPEWSATIFGAFYNRNPYFNMASFPYVNTSRFGGFLRYDNGKVGMKMGMERYYDAFSKSWHNEPIVTPVWHVSKKFDVELPLGDLVRRGLQNIFDHDNRGPMIIPNGW